jgi:ubiquitin-protein ligase
MSFKARRRLQKELQEIDLISLDLYKIYLPNDNNVADWEALIEGPPGTPYEGGKFILEIHIDENYPFKPPGLRFRTPILHPNIDSQGYICCYNRDLKYDWAPIHKIIKYIEMIYSVLFEPEFEYTWYREVLEKHYNKESLTKDEYMELAKQWTKKYAMGDD